jgi:hypothetical protein
VRGATGKADRLAPSGRAMEVFGACGGERSGDIGMQHVSLLCSTTTLRSVPTEVVDHRSFVLIGACALVL